MEELENIGKELEDMKGQDQLKRNDELQAEIQNKNFVLPKDVIVASEISEKAETAGLDVEFVEGNMLFFLYDPVHAAWDCDDLHLNPGDGIIEPDV